MVVITYVNPTVNGPLLRKEIQLVEWLLMASWQLRRDTVTELMLKENFDGSRCVA